MPDDAAVYARDKQWNTAIGLWKQTYATQKGKKKMQAAYNLAVGYETVSYTHLFIRSSEKQK